MRIARQTGSAILRRSGGSASLALRVLGPAAEELIERAVVHDDPPAAGSQVHPRRRGLAAAGPVLVLLGHWHGIWVLFDQLQRLRLLRPVRVLAAGEHMELLEHAPAQGV